MHDFYWVCTIQSDARILETICETVKILVNYATHGPKPPLPNNMETLFVDAGGYGILTKQKDYPFSPETYFRDLQTLQPNYWGSMDYPCHPPFLKRLGRTVPDQIEATLNNQVTIIEHELFDQVPGQFIPIIQGWDLDEYIYCIDRMRDRDLLTDYMTVGSLKRPRKGANGPNYTKHLILQLANELPQTRFHIFGLTLLVLADPLVTPAIYSGDSSSWQFEHKFTKVGGPHRPDLPHAGVKHHFERRILVAQEWLKTFTTIMDKNREFWAQQKTLLRFTQKKKPHQTSLEEF